MAASWEEIVRGEASPWLQEAGPSGDICLSSRVRLARNLARFPFPSKIDEAAAERIISLVGEAAAGIAGHGPEKLHLLRLRELSPLQRQILVERHLISPQHARREAGGAVVLRGDERVSIMVNEEDHLRIQTLLSGLQLQEAWEMASRIDDCLEERLDFAFDPRLGYLTACPTNTGSGLRVSAMLHLPGLVLTKQAAQAFATLSKVGVVVRGLYGEGSEAGGNLFQISNQVTLGRSEDEVIANLIGVTRQLIEKERSSREWLCGKWQERLEDRVFRAYGILTNARVISSSEALALLSDLRLGIDLHLLPHVDPQAFNTLTILILPGSLQWRFGAELAPEERDVRRAALIRERLGGDGRRVASRSRSL